MTAPVRRSPLHERHKALNAKFALFAGWEMPLEFAGGGVLKEHAAVRTDVGIFDVSHLGKVRVHGPGAVGFVNRCLSNDLDRITTGQAQYTLCCDDSSGGVVDDLIAYRRADHDVLLIPNAANSAEVASRLTAAAPRGIEVVNQHDEYAVLAVQGRRSEEVLAAAKLPAVADAMRFAAATRGGAEITVCRTGYTGERGYELVAPVALAEQLWDELVGAGARPCGLGARDTLRTEMGYPLHGHELTLAITPVQARIGWAVGWAKPQFWGRAALLAERATGPQRTLWGLVAQDRGIPRPHMLVLCRGVPAGEVTSGTFSPTRKVGIALALLDSASGLSEGDEAVVDIRGRLSPVTVVKPPFVPDSRR
jgi:aminomethyltransferase